METRRITGISLHFEPADQEVAGLFADACAKSIPLIQELWGLGVPGNCRIYVMTSPVKFVFQSASWPVKALYAAIFPLWYFRMRRQWPLIAGWTLRYRDGPAIGVKPPAIYELADKAVGERIYIKDGDLNRKVQSTICHELTHAFSAHLQLPLWLNEGIAMLTQERFVGHPIIKPDTMEFLEKYPYKARSPGYGNLPRLGQDAFVYHYARGYWLTRYLEDGYPGTIRGLLSSHHGPRLIEQTVGEKVGISPRELWSKIDPLIADHFRNKGNLREPAVSE